jgi:hypothetical protein
MQQNWLKNIRHALELVQTNQGPRLVVVVAGSVHECDDWTRRFALSTAYTSNADGRTLVRAVAEDPPAGNLFGILRAWQDVRQAARRVDVALFSIVLGKGTRLSPFTQALGNRKPAFPTPRRLPAPMRMMWISELANCCLNPCVDYLRNAGFRGVVVKWGDEALIPGNLWLDTLPQLRGADVVRFVSRMTPTPELARHKEWLVASATDGQMVNEIPRQEYATLTARLTELNAGNRIVSVNLGSFAVSYDFLDVLWEAFKELIESAGRGPDWDPYFWIAFFCGSRAEWETERVRERQYGAAGIDDIERSWPRFFESVQEARRLAEARLGRPAKIVTLDFGHVFWVDLGTQRSLREHFELLRANDASGQATRELYGITAEPDARGNIIVNSSIPQGADIQRSVLIDTVIGSSASVVVGGVLVRGHYGRIDMPHGGVAIDGRAQILAFTGERGVAFRAFGREIVVPNAARVTTLVLPDRMLELTGSEDLESFSGEAYYSPINDNPLAFAEAGRLVGASSLDENERRWHQAAEGAVGFD